MGACLGWAFPSWGLWLPSQPGQIALLSPWGCSDLAVTLSERSPLSPELPRAARAGSGEALWLPEARAAQNGDISLLLFLSLKPSWLKNCPFLWPGRTERVCKQPFQRAAQGGKRSAQPLAHPRGHRGLAGGSSLGAVVCICSLAHVSLLFGRTAVPRGGTRRGARVQERGQSGGCAAAGTAAPWGRACGCSAAWCAPCAPRRVFAFCSCF